MKRSIRALAVVAAVAAVVAIPAAPASAAAASGGQRPAAAVTAMQWPVLRQGSNSAWPPATVRSLQYLLNARGAHLAVDGVFGAGTRAAVVAFQQAHGLTPDGVAGNLTWSALIITVRRGSSGDAVRAVQDQANFRNLRNGHSLDVDGIFGPRTEAWVRGFQQAMATEMPFAVDGIVGPQTWWALVTEQLSG
jgi:peptidoglycan hydrolase-like protein with peptidoglycan-binding domain